MSGEPLKGQIIPPAKVWIATFSNSRGAMVSYEWRKLTRNYRKAIVAELMGGKRSYFTFNDGEATASDMHLVSIELQ